MNPMKAMHARQAMQTMQSVRAVNTVIAANGVNVVNAIRQRLTASALLALAFLAAGISTAAPASPAPGEFTWEAPLTLPANAPLARVAVPGDALAALRSPGQRDLRIFNGAGEAVVFAVQRPAPAPRTDSFTAPYPAHALMQSPATPKLPPGALRVQVSGQPGAAPVWVQIGAAPQATPPGQVRLPAVLFDTRAQTQAIGALELDAQLPANTPVRITASVSADLARWTPVALRGALFRFDGAGGPANQVLELTAPLMLQGQYLRLAWDGVAGVEVRSLRGRLASAAPPALVQAVVPAARGVDQGLEWEIGSTMPVSALVLELAAPNTVIPLRVLGRTDPSQAWRQLAQATVLRLGEGADEVRQSQVPLAPQVLRWLRLEALHGRPLDAASVKVSAAFEPLELVFVASGSAPFRLAAGRADTPAGDLPAGQLTPAAAGRPLSDLPLATLGPAQVREPLRGFWARMLPQEAQARNLTLWGVLLAGVLVLAGAAWRLLRQLNAPG